VRLLFKAYVLSFCVAMLSACGGSSGSTSSPRITPPPPPSSPPPPASTNYDTTEYRENYGLAQINALDAYEAGFTGDGVSVAVIDTGILKDHPQISANINSLSTNVVTGSKADVVDTDGHGTAVAGVIAAIRDPNNTDSRNSHGVAFDADILALNAVSGDSCTTPDGCVFYDSDIARALDYARQNGVKVVNISLGGDEYNSPSLINAYKRAVEAGMIIIVAGGNKDDTDTPETLAVPEKSASMAWADWANGQIIVAGALNEAGSIAEFSHLSGEDAKNVFLVAPGDRIPTIGLPVDGQPGFYLYSGTSFAAPHIAGAAALLLQAFPNLNGADIARILLSTATDLGDVGADVIYGSGLINLAEAFSPQGTSAVAVQSVNGETVKVDLSQTILLGGSAFGPLSSLSDVLDKATILDDYNRSYHIDLGQNIMGQAQDIILENFVDGRRGSRHSTHALSSQTRLRLSWREDGRFREVNETYFAHQQMARKEVDDLRMSLAYQFQPGEKLTFAQGLSLAEVSDDYQYDDFLATGRESFSDLLGRDGNQILSYEKRLGKKSLLKFAFGHGSKSWDTYALKAQSYLMMGRLQQQLTDGLYFGFDLALLKENGSILGSLSRGALSLGDGASTGYMAARLDWNISPKIQFFARGSYGRTQVESASLSLISHVSQLSSGSFSTGFRGKNILYQGDRFSFGISQPLKVYTGQAEVASVESRDYDLDILTFGAQNISLSPQGTAYDMELSYGLKNFFGADINLNLLHQINPAHSVDRASSTSILLRLGSNF